MKHFFTLIALFFISFGYAQELSAEEEYKIKNIREYFKITELGDAISISDSIVLKKGSVLKVHKPYTKDFQYVNREARGLAVLDRAADIAGTAGVAGAIVGSNTNNLRTALKSLEVMGHASTAKDVVWTADKIDALNASKKAKKLVGQDFVITDWDLTSDAFGAELFGTINKKRYKVDLLLAFMTGEILYIEEEKQ